jgi:hypothetical protein
MEGNEVEVIEAGYSLYLSYWSALESGRLSHDPDAPNYAGKFLFYSFDRDGIPRFRSPETGELV